MFEVPEQSVRDELNRILALAEEYRPEQKKKDAEEPTEAEKAEALRFLKNPGMFAEILSDFETLP